MKTYTARPTEIEASRSWYVIDANNQTLGRLATVVATLLRGKHKPLYSPHLDCGDFVIVINAEKIRLTGRKMADKVYIHHTGWPGGLRKATVREWLSRYPERVVEHAIRGMLPHNRLGRAVFRKLKVYAGPTHEHAAQKPKCYQLVTDLGPARQAAKVMAGVSGEVKDHD
ncbi:MAG: 50S ribosomal protein L13 [Cyanobacteria bacterium NC_groundwater_1444_Ag_S-0.65um_54_12]|nr:50S ribosomal protein L13 [Cyanobacteria bacterium NC_groundwater_1444_Ag_S-0.65um_54_12]